MKKTDPVRQHISDLLAKADAHISLREALKDFPVKLRGSKPDGGPHTPWQLLEHIRITQWDILEFSRSAKHKSPKWPDEYWPKSEAPTDEKAWDKSVKQVLADLEAMRQLVEDPERDLTTPIPHGKGQTLLREALLVADHNAYHLGQLVMVRRIFRTKITAGSCISGDFKEKRRSGEERRCTHRDANVYADSAFLPAIIMPAPAAIKTALMIGGTFSSCLVSMPMEAPPTLTPERSLCGMGTTSEAIPKTTNITPSQNKPFMVFSFL
jgi:hypothetical protein